MINIRDQFDLPRDQVYLNAAQIGPLPITAARAGQQAYADKLQPWRLTPQTHFFDLPEDVRRQASTLFNTRAENIALVSAASYGLATAAHNLTLKPGDEIVILDRQFPSNVYTWRALTRKTGSEVRTARRAEGQTWTEAVLAALTPRTRLVACGALHWIDGGRIDLEAVSDAARTRGAALVLDLTQSLGMMAFDVQRIDPDFAVAAAYKWLLAPYAVGFLYVAPRHQNGQPLEENWINRARSEDFSRLIDYCDSYQPGARRFDMGEHSNHQLMPAALESLQFINDLGAAHIAHLCAQTSQALAESVKPLGFAADTPDRAGHYLSLSLPDAAPDHLAARLRERGVHVSQRGSRLRVSAHVYTDEQDVDVFANTMRALIT